MKPLVLSLCSLVLISWIPFIHESIQTKGILYCISSNFPLLLVCLLILCINSWKEVIQKRGYWHIKCFKLLKKKEQHQMMLYVNSKGIIYSYKTKRSNLNTKLSKGKNLVFFYLIERICSGNAFVSKQMLDATTNAVH